MVVEVTGLIMVLEIKIENSPVYWFNIILRIRSFWEPNCFIKRLLRCIQKMILDCILEVKFRLQKIIKSSFPVIWGMTLLPTNISHIILGSIIRSDFSLLRLYDFLF